ncbi:hypothetical protein MPLDJ20_50027 [Mesorhizobium plurifarium]|uniref:Uncharacterized protein n=1 Tax=Mesorhizobium plurifarium TaxID=69974 RepID=A0A090FEY3_MESPL|nr:hypothetical protein MPLDJ20_50027 [Mesorhizobium plurifarium]
MKSQKIDEELDERRVGRRHRIVAHLPRPDPFEPLPFFGLRDPTEAAADIKRHQQMEIVIGMAGEGERRQARNLRFDAEFLMQFADQALLRRLAGLDLAAWKLPQPGELFTLGTLRQEDAPVGVDQRAGGDQKQALSWWLDLAHAPGGRR